MTPIEEGEEVDERDVINVIGPDGKTQRFRRRKMGAFLFKNGKPSNDFYQVAIRYFTVVKAFAAALAAIGALFWLINDRIIMPQQERMIQSIIAEQAKLVNDRFEKNEGIFDAHLADIANQRLLYPTKLEMKDDMDDIKVMLAEIRSRQNIR